MKEKVIDSVGELCIEQEIKVFDVPEFVNHFQDRQIPFDGRFGPKHLKSFNYSSDDKK